jgi:L-methionine (R)-S-oxide reductase
MKMPKPQKRETTRKVEMYRELDAQLKNVLHDERDFIANSANIGSLIYHTLPDLNWAGLYIHKHGDLVLGPFQGKPACVRIAIGTGVCGKAALEQRTVIVKNVLQFPGHISCDAASRSEIVVPILHKGSLVGVLDIDSPKIARFDADDKAGLETLVKTFVTLTDCGVSAPVT